MVIHPNQLSSEIRPSTGKHGEPPQAIHRAQPHPVQLRYQYHKNVWLSSHHNTIGQSVQSRKSVAPSKNIRYTPYSRDYTIFLSVPAFLFDMIVACFYFYARQSWRSSLSSGPLLCHQLFLAPLEMGSPGHEHRDRGLPSYPCARLRIWSHQTFRQYPLGTALIFR